MSHPVARLPDIQLLTSSAGIFADTAMDSLVTQTYNLNLAGEMRVPSPGSHPFNMNNTLDTIISQTKNLELAEKQPTHMTENSIPTTSAVGNPCLDFFFQVDHDTSSADLIRQLEMAWNFDSLTTLKLICNLRAVTGSGKGDKEGFYTCALWLHKHHPKTLACNVRVFAEFGYFNDLFDILHRIVEGSRRIVKEERRSGKKEKKMFRKMFPEMNHRKVKFKHDRRVKIPFPEMDMILGCMEEVYIDNETVQVLRKEREIAKDKKALEKYNFNSEYRFLHDQIADIFAEVLKSDMHYLNTGQVDKISLASRFKWCPSTDSWFDKSTLICESIAKRVFPRDSDAEYQQIEEADYVNRVRYKLTMEVLVPLHKMLEIAEVCSHLDDWATLAYKRTQWVSYKSLFFKLENERFSKCLENVMSREAKTSEAALLPHEILASLKYKNGEKAAELQWAKMVDDLKKKEKLSNCIALCAVSGRNMGTPVDVSVALSLLVSELSEDPWKGKIITFSTSPELHKIEGDSLLSKTLFVRRLAWGGITDFQKLFDQILQVAVYENLSEDKMIKKVFVFSLMEFDCASGNMWKYQEMYDFDSDMGSEEVPEDSWKRNNESRWKKIHEKGWEMDYQAIQRKFWEKGYMEVPEIVFWNLRHFSGVPVVVKQPGVTLLSGFSEDLLTSFLEGSGFVNPVDVMQLAISSEVNKKLVVFD